MNTRSRSRAFHQLVCWQWTSEPEFPQVMEREFERKGLRIRYKSTVVDDDGRSDVFFYVHDEDVLKFAILKLRDPTMRWWDEEGARP